MRDEKMNQALEASISRERLGKYLHAVGGDLPAAISLYEQNMRLSEAFYVPLQGLEVCLRNKLHTEMTQTYGAEWLTDHTAAPLNDHTRSFVNDACGDLGASPTPGQIVAELRFAFWVSILGKRYDASIWRGAAHRAFLARGGKPRQSVHGRMNSIRRFRNRVAHHEPIFHRDPRKVHEEILEAVDWMCPQTCAWLRAHSRVLTELEDS